MSEMTDARERIAELLYAYGAWASGDVYRTRNFEDDAEAVDECIAIVREALLSDSSVERVAKGGGGYSEEEWEDLLWHRKDRQLQEARSVAERVFDAAFGPGKTLDTDRV